MAQVSGLMAAAASGASSKAGAARAAASAFEDNGDLVQQLGWAHVDALSLDDFVDELSSAPASSASALEVYARADRLAACSTVSGPTRCMAYPVQMWLQIFLHLQDMRFKCIALSCTMSHCVTSCHFEYVVRA